MNIIDYKFNELVTTIKSLTLNELYYQIRSNFDKINENDKKSLMTFFNQFNYWGTLYMASNNYDEIEKKAQALKEHIDDFYWLYQNLSDYRSKKTLYAILNNWYCYDFDTLLQVEEKIYDDYFDLDLVKCNNDEVIVDLGAYTGDTIMSYINNYGNDCYKKIYCYEITPQTFNVLKQNLKLLNNIEFKLKGVSDIKTTMNLVNNENSTSANTLIATKNGDVAITTLDNDIKQPITLIKADIEGFEQKAIIGSQNHIINDHPKLLISVYHNNEDLWKIPKMIYELCTDYKFYLRYHGSNLYPTEITLIAI